MVKLQTICIDQKDKMKYTYEFDELHLYAQACSSQISFDLEIEIPI